MKKYIVVTNIWGVKRNIFGVLKDHFIEEREYFDTMDEVNEYVTLFESVCAYIKVPNKEWNGWYNSRSSLNNFFKNDKERLWGYVVGDTEKFDVVKWGGYCLKDVNKSYTKSYSKFSDYSETLTAELNKCLIKDYLFRSEDEVPKDYKWDYGEYFGWLQFRWGDGKNAVGYVAPTKQKKVVEPIMVQDEETEVTEWVEEKHNDDFADQIEDAYKKIEERERAKLLADRW